MTDGRDKRIRRTRTGCWTCRSRRKKCDETRPSCLRCLERHVKCEGYQVRLQWTTELVTPTRFSRAVSPRREEGSASTLSIKESSEPDKNPQSGALTLDNKHEILQRCQYIDRPPYRDFVNYCPLLTRIHIVRQYGYRHLETVSSATNNEVQPLLPLIEHSESLQAACIAIQLIIDGCSDDIVFGEAYDASLRLFRFDLNSKVLHHDQTILATCLLICSISVRFLHYTAYR